MGALGLWVAGPAGAVAGLSVSPDTGLTDGQLVTLTVNGFGSADPDLVTVQCRVDPVTGDDCDVATTSDLLLLDADGNGESPFRVRATDRCDAAHPCVVAVIRDLGDFSKGIRATPIAFGDGELATTTSTTPGSGASTTVTTPPPTVPPTTPTTAVPHLSAATVTPTTQPPLTASPTTAITAPPAPSTTAPTESATATTVPTATIAGSSASAAPTAAGSSSAPVRSPGSPVADLPVTGAEAELPRTGPTDYAPHLLVVGTLLGLSGSALRRHAVTRALS